MKITSTLSFIFLFICGSLSAQISSLTVNHNHVDFEVDTDDWFQDVEAKLTLKYEGSDSTTLVWVRDIAYLEDNWETAVCDPVLCYFPHISSMSFEVVPGQYFDMAVHLYPRQLSGDSARISLELYDQNNPDTRINLVYSFASSTTSSTENISAKTLNPSLYPNPAYDLLNIRNDEAVAKVELFNLLGQNVYTTLHKTGSPIGISHLGQGMYFVKLLDDNNRIIRTLRLNKR